MKIESGLFDHMVLQRDGRASRSSFAGVAEQNGELKARVTAKGRVVRGFNWKAVGKAKSGKLTGAIAGLPVGGPYRIELRIDDRAGKTVDRANVSDVLVGDVWIAAGQSNMQGCGMREGRARPHPMARAFYMNDAWNVAEDPIHNLWDAVDQVHFDLGMVKGVPNLHAGVGPAVAFAQEMHRRTGIPQGIIASGHGGTSMEQWSPTLTTASGSTLYSATLRRVRKNGGKVAGMIWYQGESDATMERQPLYTQRMKELVTSFRKDLKDPGMPWAIVQIGRVVSVGFPAPAWNSVQDQQRLLPKKIKHLTTVPAIDLTLDDAIHISAVDQQRLGRRLAYAMDALLRGKQTKPPIALRKVDTSMCHPMNGWRKVTLTFDNVVGKLHASGARPLGLTVGDPQPGSFVYDIRLDGDKVHLLTLLPAASLDGKCVSYGYGLDPICNIIDEADRSLPVFLPKQIGKFRALTPMVTTYRVAMPVEAPAGADGKLKGLKLPDVSALRWERIEFNDRFCDLHPKIEAISRRDFIIYFGCEMDLSESMKLEACIGYDGPLKLWVDGEELFHDSAGTNPAWEDKARVPFTAAAGRHTVVIALGSNEGHAWGIYFRFERMDVTDEQKQQSPPTYAMPVFSA